MRQTALLLSAAALLGAATDRPQVSRAIEERTGHGLKPQSDPARAVPTILAESQTARLPVTASGARRGPASLPPGVTLDQPLSADDAVAVALWNNRALEATLAQLGLARADLVEAGLLRNPNLSLLFPVGPKPFELLAALPVEALWQRPRRVAAARLNLEAVAEGLVQHGLDLARDVRIAHADLVLAGERSTLGAGAAALRQKIAELTGRRVRTGDAGALDLTLARWEARAAEEQAARQVREAESAGQRLVFLLGLGAGARSITAAVDAIPPATPPAREDLVETALAARPDLRAAELAVQAAVRRAGWQRSRILALAPALSSKGVGDHGVRSGPGLSLDLPLFHRNQGAISRADAEVEQASLQYLAARDQVEMEVGLARVQLEQARESLERIRSEILPAAREAAGLAEKAYRAGQESYLYTLEASRRIQDALWQEAGAAVEVRRAAARLERGVGRKVWR